jgi:hypothetical protein
MKQKKTKTILLLLNENSTTNIPSFTHLQIDCMMQDV